MENTLVLTFVILTLLQQSRAEISDNAPESWYSANVINDGFQPKPISEIFSTEPPFSTTNPIIVLPNSSTSEKILSSTIAPSNSGNEEMPTAPPIPSSTSFPPYISSVPPQLPTESSPKFPSQPPNVEITQFTEQTLPSDSFPKTQPNIQITSPSTSQPPSPAENQSTQTPPYSPPINQFLIPLQNLPAYLSTQQPLSASTPRPLSNYFIIYQQPPQYLPSTSSQEPSIQDGLLETSGTTPQSSTTLLPGSTVIIQPPTTISPENTRIPPSNPTSLSKSQSRMPSQGPSTLGTPTTQLVQSTRPCQNNTQESNIAPLPLRIRVVGPRGSITHVNINPRISPSLTTTTKRSTTTRTRKTPKPKRNTYEACIGGCKTREPICAIPLSASWIDPEKLKGFPSICHMACFNSYKKDAYEKILDGRCGRLRTRIETFDSKNKLKRDELNKAQYIIDNGDKTIVEVSSLT